MFLSFLWSKNAFILWKDIYSCEGFNNAVSKNYTNFKMEDKSLHVQTNKSVCLLIKSSKNVWHN